jgi:hypothetical protein
MTIKLASRLDQAAAAAVDDYHLMVADIVKAAPVAEAQGRDPEEEPEPEPEAEKPKARASRAKAKAAAESTGEEPDF